MNKSNYVQKLQSHSTLVVKLTSSSIDLKSKFVVVARSP